jgi:hypothetical protein
MKNEMTRIFIYVLLLMGLSSCNFPTELPIGEKEKPADNFARHFISNVITGQLDSCFSSVSSELLNEKAKSFIINANKSIGGATVKRYRVVENTPTYMIFSPIKTDKTSTYKLAYEYEFEKGNILFMTTVQERSGKFSITAFNGIFLKAPLAEITKFRLSKASPFQLLFVFFATLVPLFILVSLIVMLSSNMTTKSKLGWTFLILLANFPRFTVDGTTGQVSSQLFNITLLGSGFSRAALYYGWSVFFNLPLGAIAFWLRRKKPLKADPVIESKDPFDSKENEPISTQGLEVDDHTLYMPK